MKTFHLLFKNKQIEAEYTSLQQTLNIKNVQVIFLPSYLSNPSKISFYFLASLMLIYGTSSLISAKYMSAGVALVVLCSFFVIYFLKVIPRNYVEFLFAILICSFNNCIFLLPTFGFGFLPKDAVFLQGYAFASINLGLLIHFANLRQKIFFLVYAYAFRMLLVILLDSENIHVSTLIISLYIDIFVAYAGIAHEKKNREIFEGYYYYKGHFNELKEFLFDHSPQIMAIVSSFDQPFFANKAFTEVFGQLHGRVDSPNISQELQIENNFRGSMLDNPKMNLRLLQVERSRIKEFGVEYSDLTCLSDPVHLIDIIEQLLRKKLLGEKPLSFPAFHLHNNEKKSFGVIIKKITWENKEAMVIILNDITSQENLLNLKICDVNKEQIIATVSHELRTPLNGIIGILEIAEKKVKDKKVMDYLGLCRDNAHLLLGLVNSLLDLQQVRQGKLRLNPTKLKIKQVLSDIIRLFIFQCKNKGIYLNFKVSNRVPPYIYTDENRLKQILINLIGNAVKFTLKGGITVDVDQDQIEFEFIQISVSDTGIGIKEEDKDKLFQMYEKLEHGRSVNKNGVGLGLTISNTLACLLGGKKEGRAINVDSNIGEGSKFRFKILKDLDGGQSPENKQEMNRVSLEGLENSEEGLIESLEELHVPKEYPRKSSNFLSSPSTMNQYTFYKHSSTEILTTQKNYGTGHFLPSPFSSPNFRNGLSSPAIVGIDNLDVSRHTSSGAKGLILVVDDNMFNLLVAENIVKGLGYSFKAARNGPEAIEMVKLRSKESTPFKAILMDCQMPVMDGFEAARILRKMMEEGEVSEIPIIALTANTGDEDIKHCYESGMVDYLSKPLFANALLKVLNKSISI